MRRATIVYHYFAHYRLPILKRLARSSRIRFEFASGVTTETEALPTIDTSTPLTDAEVLSDRWRSLKNIWIARRFLWQRGLVGLSMTTCSDAVVLLGNMYHLSTWVAAIVLRIRRKRVLMWGHGFIRNQGPVEPLRALFYRLAHAHLLYGNRARTLMLKRGFHPSTLYVVYNSLDVERHQHMESKLRAAPSEPRQHAINLVFVGRLTRHKRLDILIEATALAVARGMDISLRIIGAGPEELTLRGHCERLGLCDRIQWLGAQYQEDQVAKVLATSDLCVIPGRVGLTIIHAMSYGVPVIANDSVEDQNPEIEAIIPGETGRFFRTNDARSLADEIEDWYQHSRCARDRVRTTCRSVVAERYDPDRQGSVIENAVLGIASHACEPVNSL